MFLKEVKRLALYDVERRMAYYTHAGEMGFISRCFGIHRAILHSIGDISLILVL